jgi:branched-chain amino acid transport system ATP-binding protein
MSSRPGCGPENGAGRVADAPAAPATPVTPALEFEHVDAGYGRFRALFDVSFTVPAGSVTALLGQNGAGKSTVARVATGLVPSSAGRVLIDGRDVTHLPAWKISRLGVAHAPEGRPVFASLDVEDNLRLTFLSQLGRKEAAEALERAYARFPRLAERRRQSALTLSGGEQRMLALARVLAVPPKLLVADELTLGLAPRMVDEVYRALREIRDAGTSVLVVEQQIPRALELAEHAIVLRKGRVVHAGPVSGLSDALAEEILPVPVGPVDSQ